MTNDAFLWYNVPDWGPYGLAVPNFGNDLRTQNMTILNLTQVIGRNLQGVMYHADARLRVPPSINTLTRIHKLCTRARSILASRQVPANRLNMESQHANPAAEEFLVYPVPYFRVRNSWMKEYCGLLLTALTEAYQHTENDRPIEISAAFSGLIGQYIHRVYTLMSTELFRVPHEVASAPDFTLTDEHLQSYDPTKWFTSTELIDTRIDDLHLPTEDDIEVLTNGIPVSHLPQLGRWPSGGPGASASRTGGTGATPTGESFAPAPGA